MAKILPYPCPEALAARLMADKGPGAYDGYYPTADTEEYVVQLFHALWTDPYDPGAYHTIYAYTPPVLHPAYAAYQVASTWEQALVMAAAWASDPWMMYDLCRVCRYMGWGPAIPRWNIHRGEPHLRRINPAYTQKPFLLPCYLQRFDDPPPPGHIAWP